MALAFLRMLCEAYPCVDERGGDLCLSGEIGGEGDFVVRHVRRRDERVAVADADAEEEEDDEEDVVVDVDDEKELVAEDE